MSAVAGKYQYERRLGGGGMAEVFLGHTMGAEGFQRPVAIKRVLPSFSQDPQFATMFVNEARISAMLRHPNVVQVLDFDRDAEGRLFLVMELVEGKDLDDLAKSGSIPVPVVVHIIAEVLEGLAHAHDMTTAEGRPLGLVHRDVSPHNVLLSWDGAVKVSDFGIAKAMLASGVGQSGMIKGKPLYMSPEQVTSPDNIDQRADLFAVGVMFYELLTGRRIYQGVSNEEILTDVIQVARGWRQLVAPNVLRPDLPWDVCQVALMMLAPDRRQRFGTARDALDALLHTGSAVTRGAQMLTQLMGERFPAEMPRRRMSPQQRAAAPTVVPDALRPGGEGVAAEPSGSQMRQQMAAETRTIEPVPVVATPPSGSRKPAVVAAAGSMTELATPPARRRAAAATAPASRLPLIVGVGGVLAVIAIATIVLLARDDGVSPGQAPAVDASIAIHPAAANDASGRTAAIDAGVAAAGPDADVEATGSGKPTEKPSGKPTGKPTGTPAGTPIDAGMTAPTGDGTPCNNGVPDDFDCDGIPDERRH